MFNLPNMENRDMGQPRADRTKIESPLEEIFVQTLEKYLCSRSEVFAQYEVSTKVGNYRLDFVLELDGRKVGFECDGKEYHDTYRDEWRDGLILDTGEIDVIYRFRGKDIFTFIEDCIYVVYKNDPNLFNDRYPYFCENLTTSNTIKHFIIDEFTYRNHENTFLDIEIKDDGGRINGIMTLHIIRRAKDFEGHWRTLVDFAISNSGRSLDEMISLFKEKRGVKF